MTTLRVLGVAGACLALGIGVGCKAPAETAAKAGDVTEARVASESAAETNWLLNGRTFDEAHFSTLQQINDKNVNGLGLAWYMDIDGAMGVVAEPVVVDGVIYVRAPQSRVDAVDAASGKLIWKYDPHVRLNMAINGSYSARTNAGVAVWEGKVYVGTGDCRLIALDDCAGKQLWDATVCDARQTGITGAPNIARGKVLMGYNGSDDGVRGALIAYDAGTGKEVWRFWTVPGDPSKPFETKALEMAAKTWSGKDSWKIGGGDAWNAITYDEGTGLVIFGTAGAGVDYGELRSIKVSGDKLFSGCIIAVNADTGEYVWHFQTSAPGMQTENNHILMADLTINGEKRHVAMTAPKNGFFYVLDAKTGKLLSAKPLVKTVWASAIDLQTGRAVETPKSAGGGRQWTVHNWWPMSYNAQTGLVYIPTTDRRADAKAAVESGESGVGLERRLMGWGAVSQAARWAVGEAVAANGGGVLTAGNLVFKGEVLYQKFVCDGCHSPGTDGSRAWVLDGAIPDLRYMPADVHRDWYGIVLGGSHWDQGMPGFADPPKFAFPHAKMTVQDADAIHAYVIDGAWKAYKGEQEKAPSAAASMHR